MELAMTLVLRVEKMLNLGHVKFSDSKKVLSWVDFISEGEAQLCSRKRHLPIIKLNEPSEVEKDTLSALWPEVAFQLPSRSYLSR